MLYEIIGKRKIFLIAQVLMLLVSALTGTLFISVSLANPYIPASNTLEVRLDLPENKIFYSNNVPVSFALEGKNPGAWGISSVYGVKFYLDGDSCEDAITLPVKQGDSYVFSATLIGVESGYHSLFVAAYVEYESQLRWLPNPSDGSGVSNLVHFTVEVASPLVVAVSSPEQFGTYNSSSVPLGFTVSNPVFWLGYSVDGHDKVTVAGNVTLSGLSDGVHTLTVYANDTYGFTGTSETVTFTVSAVSSPTTLIMATAVVAAVVCAGLLVYVIRLKKRRAA
jgi:hypothetical protein